MLSLHQIVIYFTLLYTWPFFSHRLVILFNLEYAATNKLIAIKNVYNNTKSEFSGGILNELSDLSEKSFCGFV